MRIANNKATVAHYQAMAREAQMAFIMESIEQLATATLSVTELAPLIPMDDARLEELGCFYESSAYARQVPFLAFVIDPYRYGFTPHGGPQ